jgi:AbrB family looped-hinge helix DNA binding protein
MTASTRLTTKGPVVIPKAMRDRSRLRPGTRLMVRLLPDSGLALDAAAIPKKDVPADDPVERALGAFRNCGVDLFGALEADHRAELADEST